MALSIALVWEVRQATGSDNNGGAFKAAAAGTDRSQQAAAQVAIDNATITTSITTTVITFTAGYTPTSADVGNVVQMLTGTNVTAGFYEITAQTATTWTVDRNVVTSGTTTDATGNMGGALATIGKLTAPWLQGMMAFLKGAFTTTATITFAAGAGTPSSSVPLSRLRGYGTVRGDTGRATITLSTNTGLIALNCTGFGYSISQIDVDCASLGTSTGIFISFGSDIRNCKISNYTLRGINISNVNGSVMDCELTGGGAAATSGIMSNGTTQTVIERNFIHDNACPGMEVGAGCAIIGNLVVNNSGATSDGIKMGAGCTIEHNTVHNNGRHGISNQANFLYGNCWRNNVITSNGGFGIKGNPTAAVAATPSFDGNFFHSNTSGNRNNMDDTTGIHGVTPYTNVLDVNLSGSPYVGGTTGTTANFALNNTAGAGAAVRAAGTPSTWPGNTGTTSYPDGGAVQHQDAGGSSGGVAPRIQMVTGQSVPVY